MSKWIYQFGDGQADGSLSLRPLLGGKGANLAEMTRLALPVPPGFTMTTEVCTFYAAHGGYPDGLEEEMSQSLLTLEARLGQTLGDPSNPLLLSVRSGARESMPGMMDTILNLGLTDHTVGGLAQKSGDERFAYDSYRRLIQMYASVVLHVPHDLFETHLETIKQEHGCEEDQDLSAEALKDLIERYKKVVASHTQSPFPQSVEAQLRGAVDAVFASWKNERAIVYRRLHGIPESWGTAVNVQAMVFGNLGDDSATGVAFTRNPSTGESEFYGEYLVNAQGEDVVAGLRTPHSLTRLGKQDSQALSLEEEMPVLFQELMEVRDRLEKHYRDMQDIEFTIQKGRLYLLQTRSGKRTLQASLRIACELVDEGLLSQEEAVLRVDPHRIHHVLHTQVSPDAERRVLVRALPASPGAACGHLAFTAHDAEKRSQAGEKVILVRSETSPEDIHGMHAAQGILTLRGGMTSHAAVVARGMGRPCVVGASALRIEGERLLSKTHTLTQGDTITLDGQTGEILMGSYPMVEPKMSPSFTRVMGWADAVRRLKVRGNAETPEDARMALRFGAQGIGLCRTEHMFFDKERVEAVRRMILSDALQERKAALDTLRPMQREDFISLFQIMKGFPVTIRLLDPPLHEFLPQKNEDITELARCMGRSVEAVALRIDSLRETNPMLGHRGCRLLNSYPEICEMQARAIFEAAAHVQKETGESVLCEVMVPLVGLIKELDVPYDILRRVADEVMSETGVTLSYTLGVMVELPRACLIAGEIAKKVSFFSFGTNDLTQTTLGLSRDDFSGFFGSYEKSKILEDNPFSTLDQEGVGALIKMAVESARAVNPRIKIGICGEHGGDPRSIAFFEKMGFDYVSCSPFRLPAARLAAAQCLHHKGYNKE